MLKVSRLKNWIGRPWSKGLFTSGFTALRTVALHFLVTRSTETEQELSTQHIENATANCHEPDTTCSIAFIAHDLNTPKIRTPKSSNRVINDVFSFADSIQIDEELKKEKLIREIETELDEFKKMLTTEMILKCFSTQHFWLSNSKKFPNLFKLSCYLLNISSSSACIERYFSICGFINKKQSSNSYTDLFLDRCFLRANISILNTLNKKI